MSVSRQVVIVDANQVLNFGIVSLGQHLLRSATSFKNLIFAPAGFTYMVMSVFRVSRRFVIVDAYQVLKFGTASLSQHLLRSATTFDNFLCSPVEYCFVFLLSSLLFVVVYSTQNPACPTSGQGF